MGGMEEQGLLKRTVKDSVFADLFGIPKYTLMLYQALHPEDTQTTQDEIEYVDLKKVLTDGIYNDLGFQIGDRLVLLLEAQSTWSPNIIIRILMYLMQTYNEYCAKHNINLYGSKKAILPVPELYVVYTGEREEKPKYISLKDDIFEGKDIPIEVKVIVLYGEGNDNILSQYVTFSQIIDEQRKKYGPTRKAVEATIDICMNENVLKDYLTERKVEVMDIMTALFDQEEVTRRYVIQERQEAVMENRNAIASELLALGVLSFEDISKVTGLTLAEVKALKKN